MVAKCFIEIACIRLNFWVCRVAYLLNDTVWMISVRLECMALLNKQTPTGDLKLLQGFETIQHCGFTRTSQCDCPWTTGDWGDELALSVTQSAQDTWMFSCQHITNKLLQINTKQRGAIVPLYNYFGAISFNYMYICASVNVER